LGDVDVITTITMVNLNRSKKRDLKEDELEEDELVEDELESNKLGHDDSKPNLHRTSSATQLYTVFSGRRSKDDYDSWER
jgi:hypothetical protein